MATVTANPKTKKASELLDRYNTLYAQKQRATETYKAAIAPLDEQLEEVKGKLEAWALTHPTQFDGKKTLSLDGGTFGFKLGAKSIAFPLDAPENIQELYFKVVQEQLTTAIVNSVDSKRVLGAWPHFPGLVTGLSKLGITVKQEDSFFITPKK